MTSQRRDHDGSDSDAAGRETSDGTIGVGRRRLLGALGAAATGTLAGCSAVDLLGLRTASQAWRHDASSIDEVLVAGDVVVVLEESGDVTALDRASGETAWTATGRWDELETGRDRVYVAGEGGTVAFDARVGSVRHRVDGETTYVAPRDDVVVVGRPRGVVALDAATGARRWEYGDDLFTRFSTEVGFAWDEVLTAVDLDTGDVRWQTGRPDATPFPELVADGLVLATDDVDGGDTRLFGLDVETGRQRFAVTLGAGRQQFYAADGTLFVGSSSAETDGATATAYELPNGQERWEATVRGAGWWMAPRAVVDGTALFVQSREGDATNTTHAFDVETGERQWHDPRYALVALHDGTAALAGPRGELRGRGVDGNTVWETSLQFVPIPGQNGENYYRPPQVAAAGPRFVAGFRGTNILSEFSTAIGRRQWQVDLDDVFREFVATREGVYAWNETTLFGVVVEG